MGGPRRTVRLRVIGGSVDLRDDVPRTRAECPPDTTSSLRPSACPHVRCRWHLWLVTGPDRPGRRFAHKPDAKRLSTLRLVMLEWPVPPSCALDVIERAAKEGWSMDQMARSLGVRSSGFRYLLAKAREELKERGVVLREFFGDGEDKRGILAPQEAKK